MGTYAPTVMGKLYAIGSTPSASRRAKSMNRCISAASPKALLKHLFPLMDDDFFWLIVIIAKEHTCAILQFVEISLIFSQKHLHFSG